MNKIKLGYKMLLVLFLCLWFNVTLGGGESSDHKSSLSLGSYKTHTISASPEYYAKYKKPPQGDPVEMAYQFFEINKSLFPITNPRTELIPKYQAFDNISGVISFQQVYQGVPIQYSEITTRFTGSGELKSVVGKYHYDINLPTTPSVDSASAVKFALRDMGSYPKASVKGPHNPMIMAHKGKFYLVWTLKVFPGDTKNPFFHWVYYVNALDGNIVYKEMDQGVVR